MKRIWQPDRKADAPNARTVQDSRRPQFKSRSKRIQIALNDATGRWEVVQPATKHLETMGMPGSKGSQHVLFPEEVFYLQSIGCTAVLDRQGAPLMPNKVFGLLAKSNVPMANMFAYRFLRNAGFVITRKRYLQNGAIVWHGAANAGRPQKAAAAAPPPNAGISSSRPCQDDHRHVTFDRLLLDAFPTIHNRRLYLQHLAADSELSPLRESIPRCKFPSARVTRITPPFERGAKDRQRFLLPLAPRRWPPLSHITTAAKSWHEFRVLFRQAIRSKSYQGLNRSGQPSSAPGDAAAACRQPQTAPASSLIEYDIHAPSAYAHSKLTPPLMRVHVFDSAKGPVSTAHLQCSDDVRTILAVVSADSVVSFMEYSNKSLTLVDDVSKLQP